MCRRSVRLLLALMTTTCGDAAPPVSASSWPEADALFVSDPRWLGADGAYTVDLGGDRILWLFGDTFLARTPGRSDDAFFLRNSLGVQTGRDPSRALMQFSWGLDQGSPSSFVAQDGDDWFWPGGGARIGGTLVLFYFRVRTPAGNPGGFESSGYRVLLVDNPDDEPDAWTLRDASVPDTGGIYPGNGVLLSGDHLYAYAEPSATFHTIYLVRWAAADAAQGVFGSPQWWCGGGWAAACDGGPSAIISYGAPELSVQPGGALAPFVMVQTGGYGSATLALRTAPAPEGPWTEPRSFFRPPESREAGDEVYAGKAHAGLLGGDLVATYVSASFYHPRFVRAAYR